MQKHQILETFKADIVDAIDYVPRPTVKAVILNEKNEVLLFSNMLIGGGVDEGETLGEALARECLEEAGVVVEMGESLGVVIQYRNALKMRYEIHGFIATFIKAVAMPSTTQEDEVGKSCQWKTLEEAIAYLDEKVKRLEQDTEMDRTGDAYYGKLWNAKTHLLFLRKVSPQGGVKETIDL